MEAPMLKRKTKDTVEVYVRHSGDCKHKSKGRYYGSCDCMKWLYIYRDGAKEERSAKTRSWADAEKQRTEILDSFDPEKVELVRLRKNAERGKVGIDEALTLHIKDLVAAGRAAGTIRSSLIVLGGPRHFGYGGTKSRVEGGHFTRWLDKFNSRQPESLKIRTIDQITPAVLTDWRTEWPNWADLTKKQNWIRVTFFFNWCVRRGWLPTNPAKSVTKLQVASGSRTTIFSDDEYTRLVDATYLWHPMQSCSPNDQKALPVRMRGLIETMRWTGMSVADALCLTPDMIDSEGVLRYRRIKTGVRAVVPVPAHLVQMLSSLPMEDRSQAGFYLRHKVSLENDVKHWEWRFGLICERAGIITVKTEVRERKPHLHMLRDTFAVYYITSGVPLNEVAKMMGHTGSAITEKCYWPWVQKVETKLVSRVRGILNEQSAPVVSIKAMRRKPALAARVQ